MEGFIRAARWTAAVERRGKQPGGRRYAGASFVWIRGDLPSSDSAVVDDPSTSVLLWPTARREPACRTASCSEIPRSARTAPRRSDRDREARSASVLIPLHVEIEERFAWPRRPPLSYRADRRVEASAPHRRAFQPGNARASLRSFRGREARSSHTRARGLLRITSRDYLPRHDPEGGRAHQIRACEQEQLDATRPFSASTRVGSVHQPWSGRRLGWRRLLGGCVLRWPRTSRVPARGLQFNPQALDACETMAVFFDSGTVGQGGRQICAKMTNKPVRSAPTPEACGRLGVPTERRSLGGTWAPAVQWAEEEGKPGPVREKSSQGNPRTKKSGVLTDQRDGPPTKIGGAADPPSQRAPKPIPIPMPPELSQLEDVERSGEHQSQDENARVDGCVHDRSTKTETSAARAGPHPGRL